MSKEILDLCNFTYKLQINGLEYFSEEDEHFHTIPNRDIYLNHSLVSISKWEAKYKVKFLNNQEMTMAQFQDYIRMMVVYDPVISDEDFVPSLSQEQLSEIRGYMDDKMTATTITPSSGGGGTNYQYITSELIYSWMASLQIPSEYQYWHINRLLMLIQVTNENNQPKKKMDPNVAMARQRAANAARRAKTGSKG